MSDTSPFTIPEDITDYSHDEAYERGVQVGIDYMRKNLTELGLAFRDYKIVHPEGTEDLHRKLTEQAATIAAVKQEFESGPYGAFWKSRAQAMYAATSSTEDTR